VKYRLRSLGIVVLGIVVLLLFLLFFPFARHNTTIYTVNKGTTAGTVASDLKARGVIHSRYLFLGFLILEGQEKSIQDGEYEFPSIISLQGVINKLVEGKVILHPLAIIPGMTFDELYQNLENDPNLLHTLQHQSQKAIAARLGLPYANIEGLFLANTYFFRKNETDLAVLQDIYAQSDALIEAQWQQRQTGNIYQNWYQALIVASMIQKESSASYPDQVQISGVIYRRLQKNMRLQIDPTVIYALGNRYKGNLTSKDLYFNSPYNTYRHRGLPPTPIAYVSISVLHAALHPAEGDALYFVAKKGEGIHVFSSQLSSHDEAIKKYLIQ
jgi:UPF0755 protein